MKKILFVALFFIYIMTSCNTRNDSVIDNVNLKSQAAVIDTTDSKMYPICMVGNIVISKELYGEKNYYANVIGDGKSSKPELLFRKGHGHNEFTSLTYGRSADKSLLLLDETLSAKPVSMTVISEIDSIYNIKTNWTFLFFCILPEFFY